VNWDYDLVSVGVRPTSGKGPRARLLGREERQRVTRFSDDDCERYRRACIAKMMAHPLADEFKTAADFFSKLPPAVAFECLLEVDRSVIRISDSGRDPLLFMPLLLEAATVDGETDSLPERFRRSLARFFRESEQS